MVAAWKKERRILYISGRIMYVIGDSPVLNSFCTGEQKNILRIQTRAQIYTAVGRWRHAGLLFEKI